MAKKITDINLYWRYRAGKAGKDEQREIIKQFVHDLQYYSNLKSNKAKGNEGKQTNEIDTCWSVSVGEPARDGC